MSRSINYEWKIQAEIRRQIHLAQVRETVSRYFERHSEKFRELTNQGFAEYLPQEFARVNASLRRLASLLASDPEQARELSMEIGGELSVLPGLAKTAEREFKVRERERQAQLAAMRKEAATELGRHSNSLILDISDPIERDFAIDDLQALLKQHADRSVEPNELSKLRENLSTSVIAIRHRASQQAIDWKRRGAQASEAVAQATLVDFHIAEVKLDAGRNPQAIQAVVDSLEQIKESIGTNNRSMSDIQQQVSDAITAANAIVVDENCRRATVRAILESLQKVGFSVGTPQRMQGDKDEVVISARKPAGAEAVFRVMGDGGMSFKFDHYEGSRCKADIDQVLPMLQEVYGVKLSNERVLWENPDRISQSERPVDTGNRNQRNG